MILLLDGYNMLHRARFGFAKGENNIVFNFFRMLKTIFDMHTPEKVYFVLEGNPLFRKDMYPEYKQNRAIDPANTAKVAEMQEFRSQKDKIIEILKSFPIEIVLHEEFECDDVIASLVDKHYRQSKVTVISSDTDFIQLLTYDPEWVFLWNPISKVFISETEYDYISWKALVGDTSDNIVGLDRVGDKTAKKILGDGSLENFLDEKPERRHIYERNYKLIKFARPEPAHFKVISSDNIFSEEAVKNYFIDMKFKSIIASTAWDKFWKPFKDLGLKTNEACI